MPEIRMSVCWPDGSQESCYSPSRVLKDYFDAGESYAVSDFRTRSRMALAAASARVKAKFGAACARAAAECARIEAKCASFADLPGARVRVDAFDDQAERCDG